MTIQQLRNEIETVHRTWYPESDEQVWPLCLAKLVEEATEWDEARMDSDCDMEICDQAIVAIALFARCPKRYHGTIAQFMASGCSMAAFYIVSPGFSEFSLIGKNWLPRVIDRWNEVKKRTPEVQRERDRARGIEIEEDMNR